MVDFVDGEKGSHASPAASGDGAGAASAADRSAPDEADAVASDRRVRRRSDLAFDEVVGQRELKDALLAVAANDDLDGLLVSGEKGTAKSTLVRGLADLLPEQRVVADCAYGCPPDDPNRQCRECRERTARSGTVDGSGDVPVERRPVPLVTVPLGATRDRLVGSLSVADALDGERTFEPGLLARANRGILYVDEVNLLENHLVDVLLDAAASGVNRVERDGVSVAHPAEFTLVGTMNPEEGDLRPQLRDRFAIQATATGERDVERRVAVVERVLGRGASDETDERRSDGDGRAEDPEDGTSSAKQLQRARDLLPDVTIPDDFVARIAESCLDAGLDGHRGDVALARTARTLAALDGRTGVIESDLRRAATYALPHRLRTDPFEDGADLGDVLAEHFPESDDGSGNGEGSPNDGADGERGENRTDEPDPGSDGHDSTDHGANGDDGASGGDGANAGGDEHGATDESGPTRVDGSDDGADGDRPTGSNAAGPQHGERGRRRSDDGVPDADDLQPTEGTDAPEQSPAGADPNPERKRPASDPQREEPTGGASTSDDDSAAEASPAPIVPGQQRSDVGDVDGVDLDATDVDPNDATAESNRATSGSRDGSPSTDASEGPRVGARRTRSLGEVDPTATARAAAASDGESVAARDLRAAVRRRRSSALVVFVVDASASMRPAMREAKGTVLELLRDAYEHRDEVAFVSFAGADADVLVPPTDSVSHAARHLKEIPTGDRTPLPAGLRTAADVIERADPAASVAVVVTDGRANVAEGSPTAATETAARRLGSMTTDALVVDVESPDGRSLTPTVVDATGSAVVALDELSAKRVDAAVDGARRGARSE